MSSEQHKDAFEFVRANIERTPFHQWLKPVLTAVDAEQGGASISLTLRPEFYRSPDRPEVHGGVLAALIDIAGHAAVVSKIFHGAPTIDLRVDYLRVASGARLEAVSSIVKCGRTIGVVDIRITDDQGRAVAIGRGSYLTTSR